MKSCIALALVACASAGDANWWGSFDRKGWSYCDKTGAQLNYMSGLYRNHCHSLYCVEMARCDSTEHQKFSQTCYNANWWGSFDRKGWSTCKNGYFITGFYRNSCHQLYCLEEAHCCGAGPSHNAGWGKCYDANWWGSFDRKGWSTCNKGYNMAGLYRNHCHHLYCLESAKCCQPSAKVPLGWNDLKTNTQGSKTSVTDVFAPFTTQAIRVAKTGAIKHGWFRVAEIDAFDVNGKQIKAMGARTDNYYGGWRKSTWAAELFDDSTNWGKGTAVHFKNHATIWFSSAVTIKTLKFVQIPHGAERYNQVNWKWQFYHGKYTGVMPTPTPTNAPTKSPTVYHHKKDCGVDCERHQWPVEKNVRDYKQAGTQNVYCAGTCGACGMAAHQNGNGKVGCSCGKDQNNKWRHMYVKDIFGKLTLSGYRTCPPGTYQPKNVCAEKCIPIPTKVCPDGFLPTNGVDTKENHCGTKTHGVVCRKTDGSGHWTAPIGCTKTNGHPHSIEGNLAGKCRVSCPCPIAGWEPSNGIAIKENQCKSKRHGVVCRKPDGSGHWTPPNGCSKVGGFPFAVHTPTGKRCTASCPEEVKFEVAVDGNNFNAAKQAALKANMAKLLNVDAARVRIVIGKLGSRRLIGAAQLIIQIIVELAPSAVKQYVAKVEAQPEAFTKATGATFLAYEDTSILKQDVCKHTTCKYSNGSTEVFTGLNGIKTDKWHCEKDGKTGCKCVCSPALKCALRHHHVSGYRKTMYHC